MFPSVSRTIPNTLTTTSFIASRAMTLEVISNFVVRVNGYQPVNPAAISININDIVEAEFTTAADFLWREFFYYKIDGVPQSFASVNKSEYTIKVKAQDSERRWYMYYPEQHRLVFKSSPQSENLLTLGTTIGTISGNYHIILEPLSNSVYFYKDNSILLSHVTLPAPPIDYIRNPLRDSIIVLVRGGEVYEIFLNSDTVDLAPFISLRNFSEFTGDMTYLNRLPGEDLITFLRRLRARRAIPPATCMTYFNGLLVAGGNGTVWIVDLTLGFELQNTFSIDEYVQNIIPFPDFDGLLLVTQSQKLYTMSIYGDFQEIYQGASLWQPGSFNGKIYIPECNVDITGSVSFAADGRLLVYNPAMAQFEDPINFSEFCPSYITVDNDKMYVCGHDSERVMIFNTQMQMTELYFSDKVTWVSSINNTLIASYYLSEYKILKAPDLFRIVEVDFNFRRGPVSHIGTNLEIVKTLGNDEVYAKTANNTWIWVNGRRTDSNKPEGITINEGDYISVSYAARVPGLSRTNVVIGDTAYDYDIEAVAQTYFPRHIDFPILGIGDNGIHSRTVVLPRFFTPCLMSLEYGSLRVNGALYYGDSLVYATDEITIEVRTCKTADKLNSVLPIFTLGNRQFVIPISAGITDETIVIEDVDLIPNTSLTKNVILTATTSRSDFIIPGYYDLTIKKNNVDITGNYYQQFGKNDELTVEFTSSRKRYDQTDVYILGKPNYKFNAKNIIEQKVNFLDYGNLIYPYPRRFESTSLNSNVILGKAYQEAKYYAVSDYQFQTANLTVTGLSENVKGNILINNSVIDGIFILNGIPQIEKGNIEVFTGDQLALARNINNYFEESVSITQFLEDPEDDLFVEVQVGSWGVINQEIDDPTVVENQYINNRPIYIADLDEINVSSTLFRLAFELSQFNSIDGFKDNLKNNIEIEFNTAQATKSEYAKYLTSLKESSSPTDIILERLGITTEEVFPIIKVTDSQADFIKLDGISTRDEDFKTDAPLLKLEKSAKMVFYPIVSKFNTSIDYLFDGYKSRFDDSQSVMENRLNQEIIFNKKTFQIIPASKFEFYRGGDFSIDASDPKNLEYKNTDKLSDSSKEKWNNQNYIKGDAAYKSIIEVQNTLNLDGYKFQEVEYNNIVETRGESFPLNGSFSTSVKSIPDKNKTTYLSTASSNVNRSTYKFEIGSYINPSIVGSYTTYSLDTSWQGYRWIERSSDAIKADQKSSSFSGSINTKFYKFDRKIYNGERQNSLPSIKNSSLATRTKFYKIEWKFPKTNKNEPISLVKKIAETTGSDFFKLYWLPPNAIQFQPLVPIENFTIPLRPDFYKIERSRPDAVESVPAANTWNSALEQPTPFVELTIKYPETYKNNPSHKPLNHEYVQGYYEHRDITYPEKNPMVSEKYVRGLERKIEDSEYNLIKFANPYKGKNYPDHKYENYSADPIDYSRTKPLSFGQVVTIGNSAPRFSNIFEVLEFENIKDNDKQSLGFGFKNKKESDGFSPYQNFQDVVQSDGFSKDLPMVRTSIQPNFSLRNPIVNERPAAQLLLQAFSILEMTSLGEKKVDKIGLKLEKQQNYFTGKIYPELEKSTLWDNDIEVRYGAFETEEDAILAAQQYTEFRPYLILNTNLWTYRAIIDTSLICELPPGRYPIAWLIRGG